MTDLALTTATDTNGYSFIDIDIRNGEPVYLDEESQSSDQRAAVSVYACKGTFPGELDYGVSWSAVYDKEDTSIQLSNEIQQQVTDYAGSSSDSNQLPQTQYVAQLIVSDEGVGVSISRG